MVSAKNNIGLLELYNAINELFCVCGDLTWNFSIKFIYFNNYKL
jgi:hypothetical protein